MDKRGRTTRGTFIVLLLLATLFLAGALAYQAVDSVASHRATADAVLEDYASFAAEQYAQRVVQDLEYYGIRPVLQRLAVLHVVSGQQRVPTPDELRGDANRQLQQSLELSRYLFRFDPRTGDVVGADEEIPEWLGSQLAAHAETTGDTANVNVAMLGSGNELRPFAYLIYRNSETGRPTGYGFAADTAAFAGYFRNAFARAPILPRTLTRGASYDSILSVRVRYADGTPYLTLSTTGAASGGYATYASHPLPDRLGAFTVEVSLDPVAAELLVIGGLPSSKLPFILGLFALTAGLIAAALLQFRRERELDRLRTEFVSNVSHELRTPLAQIRMFAETLLLGRVRSDDERHRSLSIIDKESRRLTHLVENVLLFSRSERRAVELELQTIDLQPLLAEVVDTFAPLAQANQCTVTYAAEPIEVEVDPGAVQQILLNLLDNAVKYGPTGQQISVRAALRDGNAVIRVEDQGPGIPEADRAKVWERFARLDRDQTSVVAGAGIGLSVVRELAGLHGGRAFVEAGSRGGAVFVIELPGARPPTRQEQHQAAPVVPPRAAQEEA